MDTRRQQRHKMMTSGAANVGTTSRFNSVLVCRQQMILVLGCSASLYVNTCAFVTGKRFSFIRILAAYGYL